MRRIQEKIGAGKYYPMLHILYIIFTKATAEPGSPQRSRQGSASNFLVLEHVVETHSRNKMWSVSKTMH